MLICGYSLFRITTIASNFLLFNSNPFFLLSALRMSNNHCKSALSSVINTVCGGSKVVYIVPFNFNSWVMYFTVKKGEVWQKHTSLSATKLCFFLYRADSPINSHCCCLFPKHIFDFARSFHLSLTVSVVGLYHHDAPSQMPCSIFI